MKERVEFEVQVNDEVVKLAVIRPNYLQKREAQKVYNTAFNDAVSSGAILREKLDDYIEKQGLWDGDKEAKFKSLQREIIDYEQKLQKGGVKLAQARAWALGLKKARRKLGELLSVRNNLDTHTAQGQADNMRFNYFVSVCLVYNDGKDTPVFKNLDDYLNKAGEDIAQQGASKVADLLYGLEEDQEKKLTENKFLTKYGFVNEKLQLVNKDGHLVDEEGRLIDEEGRYIKYGENNEKIYVDIEGNPVDEDGNYAFDTQPFLDDDGQPIIVD